MSLLIRVFFSPVEAYEEMKGKNVLLPGLVLIILVTGIMTYIQAPVLAQDQLRMIRENPELAARVPVEHLDAITDMTVGKKLATAVSQPVTLVIGLLFYSLILLVIGRTAGFDLTYRTALSMVLISAMIHPALAVIVKTPLILARETAVGVSMSPAVLLTDVRPTSVTYQILERFDIFLLWSLAVLIVGIPVVTGAPRRKAAVIGVLLWLASGIIVILMFAVSMKLSGMS